MGSRPIIKLPLPPKLPSFVATLTCIAVVGSILILNSTPWGPGLREDSFSYFTAADSLYQGTGLGRWAADGTFRPLTHFPPLFPIVLAAFKLIGLDFELASRLLNASLNALTSVVLGFLILRLSGSKIVAIIGVVLSSLSGVLIINYAWAHSEPLYLSMSLISLVSLAIFMKKPSRKWSLLLAILATAFCFLSRFAGIAIIGSSTIALLILPWASRRKRLMGALVYTLLSSAPTFLFMLRNAVLYSTASDRPLPIWHPPSIEKWLEGARTMLSWFLPYRAFSFLTDLVQVVLVFSLMLILSGMLVYTTLNKYKLRSQHNGPASFLWFLTLLNVGGYIALILVTILFIDRLTPLNNRILSPIYLYLLVILPVTIYKIWANENRYQIRLLLLFSTFIFVTVHAYRGIQAMLDLRSNGLGLSTPQWRASETMEYLGSLPPSVPLYTNDIPAIYFHADRMAHFIPVRQNPAEGDLREDYTLELNKMQTILQNEDGILILFGSDPEERLHTADLTDLTFGLEEFRVFEDAVIYRSETLEE